MTKARYILSSVFRYPALKRSMRRYIEERNFDDAQKIGKKLFEGYCNFGMIEQAEKIAKEAYPKLFVPNPSRDWTEYSDLAESPVYKKALEKKGLRMLGELNDEINFSHYYGSWSFATEGASNTERILHKSGTETSWEGLGELYKRAAKTAEKKDGGAGFYTQKGGCNSATLNAYWSVRAYLKAGNEEEAIETLKMFGKYKSVTSTMKKQNTKTENVEGKRGFDIPDLDEFPEFRKVLGEL